jgi:acyl phosphate:glycerol-3-phosphate acyltransferase
MQVLQTAIETAWAGRLLLVMLASYFAGSVNFSIVLLRLFGKEDPRKRFSGNPGVTNVYRQAGWRTAILVLSLDMSRAAAVALLSGSLLTPQLLPWSGVALILGNHFPCFHGFRGGKGVANFLGFYAVLLPLGTLLALGVYAIIFAFSRIPFLGSFGLLGVIAVFGIRQWWPHATEITALLITVGGIVWFHRANIAKLMRR